MNSIDIKLGLKDRIIEIVNLIYFSDSEIKMGWVYLIREGNRSRYKIGFTTRPKRRLKELQTGNSEILTLVTTTVGNRKKEKWFHRKYQNCRRHGEWFELNEEELQNIMNDMEMNNLYVYSYLENPIRVANKFVSLIEPIRFFTEIYWLDIGKAIYTVYNGHDDGLQLWIQQLQRAMAYPKTIPEFLQTETHWINICHELYPTFINNKITIKTLAWYARTDSPELYMMWHSNWCDSSMDKAIYGSYIDVAKHLHRLHWLDFIYCPFNGWFQFKNNRWIHIEKDINLWGLISTNFIDQLEHRRQILNLRNHNSNDDAFKGNNEMMMKKITVLLGKLRDKRFTTKVIDETTEYFNDNKFKTLLDTNPCLTGINNGIIEIVKHHIIFRPGKPEDYISIHMNACYDNAYTWDHPEVQECMQWLNQVFATNRIVLHNFLKFASSCLKGGNIDRISHCPASSSQPSNDNLQSQPLVSSRVHRPIPPVLPFPPILPFASLNDKR